MDNVNRRKHRTTVDVSKENEVRFNRGAQLHTIKSQTRCSKLSGSVYRTSNKLENEWQPDYQHGGCYYWRKSFVNGRTGLHFNIIEVVHCVGYIKHSIDYRIDRNDMNSVLEYSATFCSTREEGNQRDLDVPRKCEIIGETLSTIYAWARHSDWTLLYSAYVWGKHESTWMNVDVRTFSMTCCWLYRTQTTKLLTC